MFLPNINLLTNTFNCVIIRTSATGISNQAVSCPIEKKCHAMGIIREFHFQTGIKPPKIFMTNTFKLKLNSVVSLPTCISIL